VKITIPELSFVALVGPSGSGKSTFARKHFLPTEVLSSDYARGLVSDDENNLDATTDAFAVLHFIAARRLARGKLTVVDATNVQAEARKPIVALAREYHVLPVAIVLDVPEKVCQERSKGRPDRTFGPHVIRQQRSQMERSLRSLQKEGFRHVFVLKPDDVESVEIVREPLWNNRKADHGPFDIIGDVHGCGDELEELLTTLGYRPTDGVWRHTEGRRAVFVGDLVDRGPRIPDVLKIVMGMVAGETAYCVPGNHDMKLQKKLSGKEVQLNHGLAASVEQLDHETPEFRKQVGTFLDDLVSHYVFDDGRLVVAHAGMKEEMQGRGSGKVRAFALFGETTGESDEFGLPIRYNWAAEYRGQATVVYGHTPVPEPEWLNKTINIDTGCVFGGKLTALRYPERELVSVPARRVYAAPAKPFLPEGSPALSAQQEQDDVLDLADVTGKRLIQTRLNHTVTIREENGIAALEVLSRFAANPKWLIYLPPTMSPSETTTQPGLLEHPAEAFGYFRHSGVPQAICEEKHMGSRAIVVLCRDEDAARKRFGVVGEGIGLCYTRTGRRFFENAVLEQELLSLVHEGVTRAGLWDALNTDWVCLDCELMPWSVKAQELLRQQYAAVGAAARAAVPQAVEALKDSAKRRLDVTSLLERYEQGEAASERFVEAYRRYCWPVSSVRDLKLAPFHILASEGAVHVDMDHGWHMQQLAGLANGDGVVIATKNQVVDLTNPESEGAATTWWTELTSRGGEGMVVKPMGFVAKGRRGLAQPAVKVRGPEYLRIIYGPEYDRPENLERLRARGLSHKRSLALREFALGIEGLERFVRKEPLRRVHECVFGVLALESEPVDPRL